jgi:hypothetical protein
MAMELLEQIEAYLAQTRTSPSTFGRLAAGDPRLVADLMSGRRLRPRTEERLRCYLKQVVAESPLLGSGENQPN